MIWIWITLAAYLIIGILIFIIIMAMEFGDGTYSPTRHPNIKEILDVGFMTIICWAFWLSYIIAFIAFDIIRDGAWLRSVRQFIIKIEAMIIKEVLK